ncbi:MAG: U32 family peptidase, partial [Acutalibacteraceae bacterium]|nr:U32 family peptidase [Acutalibacteraceae bacterium]
MKDINWGEILSPVGNKEMLEAAVRSGADAVYLGAKDFSARRNAENFSFEELKDAIEYCHIRGVRVYLTLNIVIKNSELSDAFNLAKSAYNSGIDGIIVQDLGLARILHEKIPHLKLHASTQMSVHSPSALPILKSLGFTQVVAAREMSRQELEALCKKAKELDITVEVFVHGALCMCVSGQCLMSAFLGSRSGNRGLCAGPCRLPFKVTGGTGYDLSLKDLSLLEFIPELYKMGVRSFKIEGRMKRPEYVAAATAACRQALDNGRVEAELDKTLKNVFSRSGFTDGYYQNRLGKDMFGIRTKEDVLSADKAFPTLHELYRGERKSVAISVNAEILRDKPITLTIADGENTVTVYGNIPQEAKTKDLSYDDALKSITKFGATPYYLKDSDISLESGLFVSAGELNALRRDACEKLDKKRSEVKITPTDICYSQNITNTIPSKSFKTVARFENAEQIPEILIGIDAVLFPLEAEPDFSCNLPLIVDIP